MARVPTGCMSSRINTTSTCRVPGVGLARLQNTALANGEKRQLDIQLRQGPTFRALVLDIETNEPVAEFACGIGGKRGSKECPTPPAW